ncbi:MAG: hypothetical protein JRC66_09205 [Deltaproteobacteria bacterium]|nr:hypothetical protein [Deltaproteobacteria bacterium]
MKGRVKIDSFVRNPIERTETEIAMNEICVSAGKNVYEIIQDSGFDFDSVATYVGAASGPRWLVASGFDLSLLKSGVLGNKRPTVLAGSSAGAMRFSAWMQPEPEKSYEKLIEAYIAMNFTRKDTPETILQSIRNLIDFYIDDDALSFALTNRKYRLAIMQCPQPTHDPQVFSEGGVSQQSDPAIFLSQPRFQGTDDPFE